MSGEGGSPMSGKEGVYVRGRRESMSGEGGSLYQRRGRRWEVVYVNDRGLKHIYLVHGRTED